MPLRSRYLALLSALVLLAACGGGTSAPTPTPSPSTTPELTLEQRYKRDIEASASVKPPPTTGIDALTPDVREAVLRQPWAQDGFDDNEKQLLEFLIDAAQNFVGVRMDWPYVTRLDRDRLVQTPFDAQREVRIVESGTYDFVQTQKGTVVVVFSSDNPITREEVQPILAAVRKYLPRMEQFVGHEYRTNYLHIQLAFGDLPDISLERGSNVFLGWEGKLDRALEFVFVHEMSHSYLPLLPWDSRVWLREGMADLIAAALTGERITGYTQSASYKPLVTTSDQSSPASFSRGYFEESGNGSLFLLEMLDVIGYDAMSKVVAGMHQDSQAHTRHMADILDLMRKNAPQGKAAQVDAVIEKWTKGTGLVKPPPTPTPQGRVEPSCFHPCRDELARGAHSRRCPQESSEAPFGLFDGAS